MNLPSNKTFFFSKWHHLILGYASQKQMSSLIRPSTSFFICQTPSVSFPKVVTSYAHFVPFPTSSFSTKCHHFPLNYCITPYLIYLHPFCLFPYHSQGDHIFFLSKTSVASCCYKYKHQNIWHGLQCYARPLSVEPLLITAFPPSFCTTVTLAFFQFIELTRLSAILGSLHMLFPLPGWLLTHLLAQLISPFLPKSIQLLFPHGILP